MQEKAHRTNSLFSSQIKMTSALLHETSDMASSYGLLLPAHPPSIIPSHVPWMRNEEKGGGGFAMLNLENKK